MATIRNAARREKAPNCFKELASQDTGSDPVASCLTTCPYCGVGCGVRVETDSQGLKIQGDETHPANAGRLCVKGTALAETLDTSNRLLHPQIDGQRVSWDRALDTVANAIRRTMAEHGPEAVAFYLSGQLLTEDYYVANKLMKGFLGSANVDTNSRLCMSSAVAAYKRALGADFVPCSYSDLETCDLLVMVGSNASWTHPVLYQRIMAARRRSPHKRIVLIDPRATATATAADLHLALRPGSDGFLFGGLLAYLAQHNALDDAWLARHATGAQAAIAAVSDLTPAAVAQHTGLTLQEINTFYELFRRTLRTVSFYSQGINQSASGTDKCNAIINCHLATGRIAKPGAGPFSITGQPNAMGGREVGGLANQLAAHMDFTPESIDRVRRFWDAPQIAEAPGLKAVDLFDAVARGEVKFLWVMATNPAVSLPDSAAVRQALRRCETLVVSDCVAGNDTMSYAKVLLPAATWGEKDGMVTNSERTLSRQRAFTQAPGEARPDWRIVCDVAARLGHGAHFKYDSPAAVFREHAALSAFENEGRRDFDIGALATLSDSQYASFSPVRWPLPADGRREPVVPAFHADQRVRLLPLRPHLPEDARTASNADTHAVFTLNTGRLRDQWHSMTRTGSAPRLTRHRRFFSASLHPDDAARLGAKAGDLVRVTAASAEVRAVVELDPGLQPGAVFLPIHWSDAFAGSAQLSALLPSIADPVSGQPQSKYARVVVEALEISAWAVLVLRGEPLAEPQATYWSRSVVPGGEILLLADPDMRALEEMLTARVGESELLSVSGMNPPTAHRVWLDGDVIAALYTHRDHASLPPLSWLESLLSRPLPDRRWELLGGGRTTKDQPGMLICSCKDVGEDAIVAAIAAGATSTEALGARLACGTGCGSCLPELQALLDEHASLDGNLEAVGVALKTRAV